MLEAMLVYLIVVAALLSFVSIVSVVGNDIWLRYQIRKIERE